MFLKGRSAQKTQVPGETSDIAGSGGLVLLRPPARDCVVSGSLQDLPDVQELITQVRSEKCSLQAAAILGEPPPSPSRGSSRPPCAVRMEGGVWVNL